MLSTDLAGLADLVDRWTDPKTGRLTLDAATTISLQATLAAAAHMAGCMERMAVQRPQIDGRVVVAFPSPAVRTALAAVAEVGTTGGAA